MDKYDSLRSLSLLSVASTLGIDLKRFKRRKDGELQLRRWPLSLLLLQRQRRGAIDLTMAIKGVNFTQACEILGGAPKEPPQEKSPVLPIDSEEGPWSLRALSDFSSRSVPCGSSAPGIAQQPAA